MLKMLEAVMHFRDIPLVWRGRNGALTVADQVQELTIPAAMRPGFTLREAVLNSSACREEKAVYRFCNHVTQSMRIAKTPPIPMTYNLIH
jgi:hypothetical protein